MSNPYYSHNHTCGKCHSPYKECGCQNGLAYMPGSALVVPPGSVVIQTPTAETSNDDTVTDPKNDDGTEATGSVNSATFTTPCPQGIGSLSITGASSYISPGNVLTFPVGSITVDSVSGDNVYFTNEDIPCNTEIITGTAFSQTVPIPATVLLQSLFSTICKDDSCGSCGSDPLAIKCIKSLMVCGMFEGDTESAPIPVTLQELITELLKVTNEDGVSLFDENSNPIYDELPDYYAGDVIFSNESGTPLIYVWNPTTGTYDCVSHHKDYLNTPALVASGGSGTVDLNTLAGVTVPAWATHAIVRLRLEAGAQNSEGIIEINGDEILYVFNGGQGGDDNNAIEVSVPLNSDSFSYLITLIGTGTLEGEILLIGFEHIC